MTDEWCFGLSSGHDCLHHAQNHLRLLLDLYMIVATPPAWHASQIPC